MYLPISHFFSNEFLAEHIPVMGRTHEHQISFAFFLPKEIKKEGNLVLMAGPAEFSGRSKFRAESSIEKRIMHDLIYKTILKLNSLLLNASLKNQQNSNVKSHSEYNTGRRK